MKATALGIVAATLLVGVASAQTMAPRTSTSNGAATAPVGSGMSGSSATGTTTGGTAGTTTMGGTTAGTTGTAGGGGQAAASGNDNQAVATTSANAMQPAHGRNSFSIGQARYRIQHHGYTHVTGLKKSAHGVWRGTAQKNGQSVPVWLDYKGNVGQG